MHPQEGACGPRTFEPLVQAEVLVGNGDLRHGLCGGADCGAGDVQCAKHCNIESKF